MCKYLQNMVYNCAARDTNIMSKPNNFSNVCNIKTRSTLYLHFCLISHAMRKNKATWGISFSFDETNPRFFLRDNLQENFSTVRQAFKAIDKENLGYIRKSDLRRILFDFNFLVDDDQFDAILQRCGMADKSRLSYKTFLAFFEGPQTKQAGIENFESFENKIAPYIDSYPDIENKDAENKMKFMVSEISDVLLQAFSAMDWKESGLVLVEELRRVLNNFCFNMTDKQFNVSCRF